ncbi:MAG: snoRNP complex protein nop56 [Marteilia pararefringens]
MTTSVPSDEYSEASKSKIILYESSAFFSLFRFLQYPTCDDDIIDHSRFASIAKLVAFHRFENSAQATESCTAIFHGSVPIALERFLEDNLSVISDAILYCQDPRLAHEINRNFELKTATCEENALYIRGLRIHAGSLLKSFITPEILSKSQLAVAHGFSRNEMSMKQSSTSDNMIVQSSTVLEQTDKNANNFYMKIREWYGYHFPELAQVVTDPVEYIACVREILDRKNLENKEVVDRLKIIFENKPNVVDEICQKANYSVGGDINDDDLHMISQLTSCVNKMQLYRVSLKQYVSDKLSNCCPNLQHIVGDHVASNFLTKAGNLQKLSKLPASTLQILGAEKALFKAIKSKGKTPKYGYIFNSSYITKAAAKYKGKIARLLANKCAIAIRMDRFHKCRKPIFGEALKQRLEEQAGEVESAIKKSVEEVVNRNRQAIEQANAEVQNLVEELEDSLQNIEDETMIQDAASSVKKLKVSKKRKSSKKEAAIVV